VPRRRLIHPADAELLGAEDARAGRPSAMSVAVWRRLQDVAASRATGIDLSGHCKQDYIDAYDRGYRAARAEKEAT